MMKTSFKSGDVKVLLKDISGMVRPLDTAERERLIQSGIHYSEMLPLEYRPSAEYMEAYSAALEAESEMTANSVKTVAEKIFADKGRGVALVSLARAGTSIGVLIKRYLRGKYQFDPPHYTISIIRGKGIDQNAMKYILDRHPASAIQFVDGWTGKGAIQNELNKAMIDFPSASPGLAVLSDPAGVAEKCGTREDFLIPSSCLNSTVSGLMSRTFYRDGLISKGDFHGAAYYGDLLNEDLTYEFIDAIERHFSYDGAGLDEIDMGQAPADQRNFAYCGMGGAAGQNAGRAQGEGLAEVAEISERFGIRDINLIKPSIGEATRVLLRRVPWKILVHSKSDEKHLGHMYKLAAEKGVEVEEYPLASYKACGIIRALSDI